MKLIIFTYCFIFSLNVCHAQSNKAVDYYNKGVEYNKTGKLVEASIQLTEAVSIYSEYAQAYYQRSLSFKGMAQLQHARKDLMKAIDLGIKNVNPYLTQINYYKSTKQFTSAILITKKLLQAMPENSAGAYYDQGLIYEEINKYKEANIAYSKSLEFLDSDSQNFKEKLLNKINQNKEKIQ